MKLKSLLLVLFLLTSYVSGQDITLKGRITDSQHSTAVQGAVVFISYNFMTYSNSDGIYSIKNIPEGKYEIKISRLGYRSVTDSIEISSPSTLRNFILVPSPVELGEVIVSTDRADKFLRNSPYSELVIGKTQIEAKSYQSLPDAMTEEPGISLLRDGIWGTEISIRGLNRENIVTLIDGSRIATSTDIAARLSMINLNDIDRVEIIKGASSSIYGSGATGGIVNIITKSPQLYENFSTNGNIQTGFNSVNNLSATSGTLYLGDSFWSSKLSGSYRKAGNTGTPSGELKNSQFEDYSFSGSLNIMPLYNHTAKIEYQLFKALNVGIPGGSAFPTNADVRYPYEKREMISAGYEIQNISKSFYKLSADYSYQFIDRDVENIPHTVQTIPASGSAPAKRVSVLKITPGAGHKNNNFQIHGNFLLGENNLVLGIDYWDRTYNGHREKYQKIEVLNPQGGTISTTNKIIGEKPLPDSKYKSLGLFAQNEADIIKNKFSFTLGARYDLINITGSKTLNPVYDVTNGVINYSPAGQQVIWNEVNTNDASYSGNLGLKYSPSADLDFTLGLGLSFRSPSLEERFQYIDLGSYVRVGSPDLKSEKGKSADLGIRYYSPDLKIVSSFFVNYFNDLVSEMPGTFEGRSAYIKTNIGEAKLYGFDFRTDYNFYDKYILFATASYVKGDDITSGGNLPEIPPLNGNIGLKWEMFNQVSAEFSSTVFASQNEIAAGEIATPGYAVFNLSLGTGDIRFAGLNLKAFAGIDNIFNKEYRNHLSTIRGLIVNEPGRNLFVNVSAKW